MEKKDKKKKIHGLFLRLPRPMVRMLDEYLETSMYYTDRSQFIRIALTEKMRKEGIMADTATSQAKPFGVRGENISTTGKEPLIPGIE